MKNRHSQLDWEDGHNIWQAAFALHTGPAAGPPGKVAGKNGQGLAVKRARSHFNPGTLPVQSVIACCLAHFPPARSQPKNSTLPASPVIHPLQPHLLRLRPSFTSFGRAPSGFARHSRLGREAGHTIRQAGKVAGKNGQGLISAPGPCPFNLRYSAV